MSQIQALDRIQPGLPMKKGRLGTMTHDYKRNGTIVAALRHKTRARMCPAYIAGLIGPEDRKSVQPMAARAGEVGYDQLHHFVAAGVWDSALTVQPGQLE